ncbi:type I 3-dehydroquinate dehydratase [Enterococcus sp. HY326]|uniref:type I 3-dehydroquinate dehydratase n=1 Tax=Enterococcus sp. HY326 TaxID=2971265 RepID=UPI002240B48D|nr:type I 3-dehydroquinate dehydratase [Enterococcus sp. HY326]
MKSVVVRDLILTDQEPKICVAIKGDTQEEIFRQATKAVAEGAELLEWRGDYFKEYQEMTSVLAVLQELRQIAGNLPVIFSFLTPDNDGINAVSPAILREIYLTAAESGLVDLLELQLIVAELIGPSFMNLLRGTEAKLILSHYYLDDTPDDALILFQLNLMEHLKADIGKIVAHGNSRHDVMKMMSVGFQVEPFVAIPIILFSSGDLGRLSQIAGGINGSCIAYSSVAYYPDSDEYTLEELQLALELLKPQEYKRR